MEIRATNPMKGTTIPKAEKEHLAVPTSESRNYWEKAKIKKFLAAVKRDCTPRDQLMFHLLIYTGARKGEVLALRWGDVDAKAKTINFSKTLFQDKSGFTSLTSKTAASRRIISLDDNKTLALIKKRRTSEKERLLAIGSTTGTQDNDYFFTREDDSTPLRLAYPNDKLAELIKAHNLHTITIHSLRHTHASLLFEAGASIKEVQERLGHSDIQMTMNIYTHVTKAAKEKAADRFEKFLEL
ncbi:site-specific integrase [Gorillibacterium timonense]|uniref:site-specific integrase n=1 Tax=Gorillibacterium timonense TaxID=1689269 RepID=UPI00370965E5